MERKIKEIILIGGLIVVVVIAAFYVFKISRKGNSELTPVVENQQIVVPQKTDTTKNGENVPKELKELDDMNKDQAVQPSQEEIQKQLKELETQRADQKPATQEEINNQLKELNVSL